MRQGEKVADLSLEAWKSWKQAQQKYDYFVVGLSSALFAYLTSKITVTSLSTSQDIFNLSSLFFIFVSLAYGILKIEWDISRQSTDYRKAYANDHLNVANEVLNTTDAVINKKTGKPITKDEAHEIKKIMEVYLSKAEDGLTLINKDCKRFYIIRNACLFIGFILIYISKIVVLY